jgi:hypothetical protein
METCKFCGTSFKARKSGNVYYCPRIEKKNFLGFWMTAEMGTKIFCSNQCLSKYIDAYGLKDGERAKQG